MTLVFSLLRCYTELNALRKGGYTCNGLERLRFLQKRKPLSFSGSKCTLLYLSAESGACSMRPAALLWGAFVLHRRFPFVKASPLGRGVTEGDGEGKAADGEAPIQRYSYSDKETTYRCTRLCHAGLALSGAHAPALPKGEPLGRGKAANSLQRVHISIHNNRKGVPP